MDFDGLVILGPTAVGKTDVGILLAEQLNGEIISCDSMQIYKEFDIGTAKPTLDERARVPIHLIDFVDPIEYYSAASYQNDAREMFQKVLDKGKLPIIVGGTGLYFRAFAEGFNIPPFERDLDLRKKLKEKEENEGIEKLYLELLKVDAETAGRLSPNDKVRIIRALEVYYTTGKSISSQQTKDPVHWKFKKFCLNMERNLLYERINIRTEGMIKAGWLEETNKLISKGYGVNLTPMKSLGYKHLAQFISSGEKDMTETVEAIKRDTRRYAKRQLTWFRSEPDTQWVSMFGGVEQATSHILMRFTEEEYFNG